MNRRGFIGAIAGLAAACGLRKAEAVPPVETEPARDICVMKSSGAINVGDMVFIEWNGRECVGTALSNKDARA